MIHTDSGGKDLGKRFLLWVAFIIAPMHAPAVLLRRTDIGVALGSTHEWGTAR